MLRSYKYRLWTNRNQDRELGIMLETHRRLYNACLYQRKISYENEKLSVKYKDQSSWYKEQRATNPYSRAISIRAHSCPDQASGT